jgi:hypothetical protein
MTARKMGTVGGVGDARVFRLQDAAWSKISLVMVANGDCRAVNSEYQVAWRYAKHVRSHVATKMRPAKPCSINPMAASNNLKTGTIPFHSVLLCWEIERKSS